MRILNFLRFGIAWAILGVSGLTHAGTLSVREILNIFAADYAIDPSFRQDVTFGVKVDDERWHIVALTRTDSSTAAVRVLDGFPDEPTFYYETTEKFLRRILHGEMSADTGAVRATQHEYSPVTERLMDGADYNDEVETQIRETLFHFWTRGMPEVIKFGPQYARNTHGAMVSVFYYGEDLRTSSFILYPGMHANEDPSGQANPFKSLVIIISGQLKAVIGGKEVILKKGDAVLIPEDVSHEFMNPFDEMAEGILLMFGLSA